MTGSLFALLAAVTFALHNIFLRRAVLKVTDPSLGMLISVPMSVPVYYLVLTFTGRVHSVLSFSGQSYVCLILGGVLHFVIGRSLHYKCVQLAGANIALILSRVNILISVLVGVFVLHEPLSWYLATGVLLIIIGITLPGLNPNMLQNSNGQFSKIPAKAFIIGFGGGLVMGISPIFIKLGLKDSGSPVAGALISFLAASAVLSISLANHRRRASIAQITGQAAGLFFSSGLLSCIANLIRFIALSLAPASVAVPLFSITPVFLLVFSFIFNRKIELFSGPVIIGIIMVVIGSVLLI
jgi:drug/metabolite transporter (DMT)-like permease